MTSGKRALPLRTCVGCRKAFEKTALIRIVQAPDGQLVPDVKAKLPGRGVYLCSRLSCLQKAVRKDLLSHAFRNKVQASEIAGLEEKVLNALQGKVQAFLGVLRKGNQIVVGRESIRKKLKKREVHLLLLAVESSAKRAAYEHEDIPLRVLFSRERLGRAVGKAPQPVVGVLDERASLELIRLIDMADRLSSVGGGTFYGE